MGIAQEVVAGNPSNDTVAQLVVHGGQGPVSMFHAMNPTNEHTALSAAHEGLGSVAFFNNNPLAAAPAVIIENKGNTEGLKVVNAGDTAVAASFSSLHTAGTEPVMEIVQQGKKHAIFMRVKNTTNSEPMVFGQSDGLGGLLDMELTSIVNTAAGIQITHAGYGIGGSFTQTGHGTALRGFKTGGGTGRCGEFINDDTTNFDDGVLIQTNTSTTGAFALHANNTGPGKGALLSGGAHTGGDHSISGLLSKGGGTFKIDHPHDPENKYLYHSFVESPDMMNVYNGNVVLNSNGKAVIQMPAWFEDLNKEFRYQLTCIGGYANVYVSQEMSGGQFEIAGGKQGLKVSWQVTGIRKDKFADANRVQVEAEKPEYEKGTYLHPEAWGQDKSRGLDYKLQRDHGLQK